MAATKRIRTGEDVEIWQKSDAYRELTAFIAECSAAVSGVPCGQPEGELCPALAAVINVLAQLSRWVDEIPLQDLSDQRFGNRAYRTWHARVLESAERQMAEVISAGGGDVSKAAELAVYWCDAFGNPVRIDYGTGHELHFCVVLMLLCKVGCVPVPQQLPFVVNRVFARYLALTRKLQTVYSMEPAGSHGVWGLDDYHHLPFIWGASQLIGNPRGLEPKNLLKEAPTARFDYLYLDCIAWIMENKRGPFFEHSPTLHSVSVLTWPRLQAGLMKMYCGEVLLKWPIVQHMPFGSLLRWPRDAGGEAKRDAGGDTEMGG